MSVSFASGPLVLNQFEYNGDFRRKLQSHGGAAGKQCRLRMFT